MAMTLEQITRILQTAPVGSRAWLVAQTHMVEHVSAVQRVKAERARTEARAALGACMTCGELDGHGFGCPEALP
jgi:hypothetical protein